MNIVRFVRKPFLLCNFTFTTIFDVHYFKKMKTFSNGMILFDALQFSHE